MGESFNGVAVPADGARITYKDGQYQVPDNPVIPFIEGDGTGRDIWKASARVFNARWRAYKGQAAGRVVRYSPAKASEFDTGFPMTRSAPCVSFAWRSRDR